MAQKKLDVRLDIVEQEMKMVKEQLQKLPEIERLMEQMAQNLVRSLQSMKETQKLVAAMAVQKGSTAEKGEDSTSVGSERTVRVKENTLDRTGETAAGVDGWAEGLILAKEGALLTDSGSADRVTWLWHSQQPCDDDLQVSSWDHKELERLMMTTKREDRANGRRTGSSVRQKERPPELGKQPAPTGSSNPPPLPPWIQSPIRTRLPMEAPPVKPLKSPKQKAKDSIKKEMRMVVTENSFMKGRLKVSAKLWLTSPNGLGLIVEQAQLVEEKTIGNKTLKELPGLKSNQSNPYGATEFFGGTIFGRTSGGPFYITSYGYDAPIDENGLLSEPKWGHLKDLHAAVKLCEPVLVAADSSQYIKLGPKQEAYVYRENLHDEDLNFSSYPGKSRCSSFLANIDEHRSATVFLGQKYNLPPWSVSILPWSVESALPLSSYISLRQQIVENNSCYVKKSWMTFKEPIGIWSENNFTVQGILEHLNVTKDYYDYLSYMTRIYVSDDDISFWKENNISPAVRIGSMHDVPRVFVNGLLEGSVGGCWVKVLQPVQFVKGYTALVLLSQTVNLQNYGAFLKKDGAGFRGQIKLTGFRNRDIHLSKSLSTYQVGAQKVAKNWQLFLCVGIGLWAGLIRGFVTEYYTSSGYSPVQGMADSCTNVIIGLALRYKSIVIRNFAIAVCIFVSFNFGAIYGIVVDALGTLSTIATGLVIDAYGTISVNAGRIAELAGMSHCIREWTDALDALVWIPKVLAEVTELPP